MRIGLFTDTLGDINGVSRFIRNVAEQALAHGCELHAITSTRFECPPRPNIHNLKPRLARPMPGYPQLDVVIPRRSALYALADRLRPDVVHISTPGPVGTAGRRWARKRGVPIVGTYHTDFPAYIDHLFDEPAYTWLCTQTMKWFYRPFQRVFTRSDDYGRALVKLGYPADRIVRLLPGIDTETFHTRYRDASGGVWAACPGVRPASVKALYVGRVSVEKNLPLLTGLWPRVHAACAERGLDAQLLVVGDGPYRERMRQELAAAGADACFLGFRHGRELSTIYASSDLFVFPSTTDTLGQVVMEAQSAGLPVLVTDQGGPSEVVDDGKTGFVLPAAPAAASRWVETIVRLIADSDLRRTMGAAGHAKIQPMSIRHSFEHFWQVHEEVARENRAPRSRP
jgi:glycosyltransferase involved in cell wall biosynthesis